MDFKRFYEKISLDNALTQEDFAVKIKALEKQRNDLELAEQLEFALFGFELDKQYNEWEKEQNLHAIEWQIQNFAQQMLIKNQIQDEKHQYDLHHFENNKNYLQKAHEVDTMQFASYRPLELLISNNIKKQCDCLLEGLADCIEIFQAHLIAIVENTWNLKKSLRNDLSKFLLVTIKNELPLIEPHYSHELTKIEHFCLEYYKLQNKRFKNFLRSVASQAHNLLQEVKATMAIFKNYYLEEQAYREEMDKKMNSSLLKSYENALLYLAGDYHQEENNEKNYHRQVQDEKEKHRLSMELKKQTAMKLYHDQLKAIEEKSKKATLENQRLVADEENNYQLFIKNSKQKQSAFKRDFSDHLILHERSLDKQYRLALQRNEKERKAKIKAL